MRHLVSPRWRVNRAFPAAALSRIEKAVARSESRHGGQIRFAVEHALDAISIARGVTARARALEVFSALRVWDTEHNNGVLIYLLLADRDVEIVADRGIHALANAGQWESTCGEMEQAFRAGKFEDGVLVGIERISHLLESRFPHAAGGSNELSDQPVVL